MAATEASMPNGSMIRIGTWSVPSRYVVVVGIVVLLFLAFHYPGLRLLADRWNTDDNYGHGWLIPAIALYFVWTKKEDLLPVEAKPCLWGLAIFLAGLPLRFLALPLNSAVIAGWSVVIMANGLVLYLGGWRVYRVLWLPTAYLVFMVPLPQGLYNAMANPLQRFASIAAAFILENVMGVRPIVRDGNVIKLLGETTVHTLQVAEACSGMRSIMGLLALGVAFAYFWERSLWERLFLVGSTIPIAILANICRVTGTGLLYHRGYERFAQGLYHQFTGWFVFIFAMTLFLLEAWLMGRLFVDERRRGTGIPACQGEDRQECLSHQGRTVSGKASGSGGGAA